MAIVIRDRVKETSTTTGTGAITLAGAVTKFNTFYKSGVLDVGAMFPYQIEHPTLNEWETGIGTLTASNTFARTLVTDSSNSGSAVSFSAGTKVVSLTATATIFGAPVVSSFEHALHTHEDDEGGGTLDAAAIGSGVLNIARIPALPYLSSVAFADVTGTATSAQIAATLTGKTLVTPTIASFANATHNHQNAAGGGTLDASAIATGTIDSARLPSITPDWASPGTIGSTTANTGAFTTLTTSSNILIGPAGASIGAGRVTINQAASSKMIVGRLNATTPGDILYVRNSADARTVFQVNANGGIYVQNSSGDPGSLDGGASWSIGTDISNNLIIRSNGALDLRNNTELRVPASVVFPSSTSIALNLNGGAALSQTRTNIQAAGAYTDIVKAGSTQSTNDIARWTDQAGSTIHARITSAGVGRFTGLQIDVSPTAETITPTHTITISVNGTNYKIPIVAA